MHTDRVEITLTDCSIAAGWRGEGNTRTRGHPMTGAWQWPVKNKQVNNSHAGRPAIAADYYVTAALHFSGLLSVGKRIVM